MIETLEEMFEKSNKKLLFFHGDTLDVIKNVSKNLGINSILC